MIGAIEVGEPDFASGDPAQVIAKLRARLARQPKDLNAMQQLAFFLIQSGQPQAAIPICQRMLALAPNVAGVHSNYAQTLMSLGRFAEAQTQFRVALKLEPNHRYAATGLVQACERLGQIDAALAASAAALERFPNWPLAIVARSGALGLAQRHEEALALLDAAIERLPDAATLKTARLLPLGYVERSPEVVFAAHRAYGNAIARPPEWAVPDDPDRPLTIGVLSADLRAHSVAYFAQALFAAREPGETLVVLATHATPNDPLEKWFRARADRWIDATAFSDAALDQAIRRERIDVLLELNGHTTGGRLSALNQKPARLIIHAIGYPNTTAHPAVDFRLVDAITDPPGCEALMTEKPLRVAPCFLCFTPPDDAPPITLHIAARPLKFGSFNLLNKLTDQTLAVWARALDAVPSSQLLIKSRPLIDSSVRAVFEQRLIAAGIDRQRVELRASTPSVAGHLAMYSDIDIALDSLPYSGTTTTCEALWMGVPVLTMLGDRHMARVGASLLNAIGKPEWIARDAADFAERARSLANAADVRAAWRRDARAHLKASTLLDAPRYALAVRAQIRSAWRAHVAH
jgi:protein O-GlcNAc transferase